MEPCTYMQSSSREANIKNRLWTQQGRERVE